MELIIKNIRESPLLYGGIAAVTGLSAYYIWNFFRVKPYPVYIPTTRLDGKIVIITGANTGIGKQTAIDLAKLGARVILACRDAKRANAAAEEIKQKSSNNNVVVEIVDLASLESIKAFTERILKQESRLDILVNNAGIN